MKSGLINADESTRKLVASLIRESIDCLLNEDELSLRQTKLTQGLSRNQSMSFRMLTSSNAYVADAISVLESNNGFSEIAIAKIKYTEELKRTEIIKGSVNYLVAGKSRLRR